MKKKLSQALTHYTYIPSWVMEVPHYKCGVDLSLLLKWKCYLQVGAKPGLYDPLQPLGWASLCGPQFLMSQCWKWSTLSWASWLLESLLGITEWTGEERVVLIYGWKYHNYTWWNPLDSCYFASAVGYPWIRMRPRAQHNWPNFMQSVILTLKIWALNLLHLYIFTESWSINNFLAIWTGWLQQ